MIEPYSKEEQIFVQRLVVKHKRRKAIKLAFVSSVVILLIVVSVYVVVSSNGMVPDDSQSDFVFDQFGWSKTSILTIVEDFITPRLKFPTSAVYSNEQVVVSEQLVNYNTYLVTGSVESLNSFGTKSKQSFSLSIFCYAHAEYEIKDFILQ